MKTKHTPAPWNIRYFDINDKHRGFFVKAKKNNIPQLVYGIEIMMEDFGEHNGYPLEQREADAKLIAAAPELLEALIEIEKVVWMRELDIIKCGFNPTDAIIKAILAIKKATE